MNKYLLITSVAIMTLGIASESWAATSGCDCGSTANGGSASDCCWKIEDGVLTIYPNPERSSTGNVTMADFSYTTPGINTPNGYTSGYSSTAPWARQGAISVVVENGISNIGKYAFNSDTKITSVTGMENVTTIGNFAFKEASSLQRIDMPNVTTVGDRAFNEASLLQSVNMPKVTSIGLYAFANASSLTNIIIPDDVNVNNWNANAFGSSFTNNVNSIITCLGNVDTCKTELSKKYKAAIVNKVQPANDTQCNSSVNYYYSSSGCVKLPNSQSSCEGAEFYWVSDKCTKTAPASSEPDPQGQQEQGGSQESEQQGDQGSGSATSAADCAASGKYWQEGKCVSSCGASFKLNDGWCDRQRYTPAEAAQMLTDDNNNSVTITFKK